ncbi:hypothetical protein [Bradyrhizobium sp.]|uniref:hypothetical protein n=1 Tax=Bradyrhizobium sp. TaxID=376 RepID=UPI003BB212EC
MVGSFFTKTQDEADVIEMTEDYRKRGILIDTGHKYMSERGMESIFEVASNAAELIARARKERLT